MILAAKTPIPFSGEPYVALIEDELSPRAPVPHRALVASQRAPCADFPTVFGKHDEIVADGAIRLPPDLSYLASGDIVRINPKGGEVRVMYRRNSRFNAMLLTERCNSRCVMCSQPPREVDDGYLAAEILTAIPLMATGTVALGFSGGEPTLLGDQLLKLIRSARDHLPATSLHILSNGRLLRYLSAATAIAEIRHPDLMIGVPLYGDTALDHDFVVQSKGAFAQTVLGLANLGRVGVPLEIRVVLHRFTMERLPHIARFIARNFPFVAQVVWMGLEFMGYARSNASALWVNPREYTSQLQRAVELLEAAGIRTSIYNLPLCFLREELHRFARQSISDWKNVFPDDCSHCADRPKCSGLFESGAPWMQPLLSPRFVSDPADA